MRRTRKTLYVVTSLYVFLGLVILVGAAIVGDPLSSFIGFIIVGGALGAAVVLVNIFRVSESMERLREEVRQLSDEFHSVSAAASLSHTPSSSVGIPGEMTNLDLTTLGGGEVLSLTAATLDRDRFPRLFVSMDSQDNVAPETSDASSREVAESAELRRKTNGEKSVVSRNLLREWNIAIGSHNLRDAQRIFSALVDMGNAELVGSLQKELTRLSEAVELRFRTDFSALVKARQFGEAMALGDEMASLFVGQPIESQFLDLKPTLQRAMAKTAALDQARVVQNS